MRSIHTFICWMEEEKDVKWKRDGEELHSLSKNKQKGEKNTESRRKKEIRIKIQRLEQKIKKIKVKICRRYILVYMTINTTSRKRKKKISIKKALKEREYIEIHIKM